MNCKYPIILVHGLAIKQLKFMNAFGKIENVLIEEGHDVYVADIDGFGTIETNAEQLKNYVTQVLEKTDAQKVNIIAHSKGGLDTKYMITMLGMEDKIASLTTLCTPHKGSIIASKIWDLPLWLKKIIAFFINKFYKICLKDEKPDAITACNQLRYTDEKSDTLQFSYKVYFQCQ